MDENLTNSTNNENGDLNSFEVVNKTDVEEKPSDEWLDILGSGQLKKKILKEGEPDSRPQIGEICFISGFGKLEDDTIVETFDNAEIILGDAELIQGMDFVLPLMEMGEESLIEVGPRFAYGELGNKDLNIPPNSTLTYQITLHLVQPALDIGELSIERRLQYGSNRKTRGNWFYLREENSSALQCYRRALDFLDSSNLNTTSATQEEIDAVIKERINVYNNLAQTQIRLDSNESALISLDNVLALDLKNVKALIRKAKVLTNKNEADEAIELLKFAQTLDSSNKLIPTELAKLYVKQKSNVAREKEVYQKMFAPKPKKDEGKKDETSGNSLNKIILVVGLTAITLLAAGGLFFRFYHQDLFEQYFWILD